MSDNGRPQPQTIELVAKAAPGVVIRIFDAGFQEVGRGTGEVRLALPEGLYSAEWSSAGSSSETFVRLNAADPQPVIVSYDPSSDPANVSPGDTDWAKSDLVSFAKQESNPSERDYGSSVAIIVTADPGVLAATAMAPIRLIGQNEKAMRANDIDALNVALQANECARSYRVRPGKYRLRVDSVTGDLIDQTIPALPGRRTILFLQAAVANILVAGKDGFETQTGYGIDPARSVIVSVLGTEPEYRIRERVRLTQVLLHDLASGGGSLSAEFVDVLDSPDTDPLLKLYGALVAVSRLEGGFSPALDKPWPTDPGAVDAFREAWAMRVERWVPDPQKRGLPSDATTLWWQLAKLVPNLHSVSAAAKAQRRIQVPPMFECSWRWAIGESIARPDAILGTASMLAVARTAGGSTPWLCWSASAVKAPLPRSSRQGDPDLPALIRQVSEKAAILSNANLDDPTKENPLDQLSADIRATVLRAAQVGDTAGMNDPASTAENLATSLSLPARQLERRLDRANTEIDALIASMTSDSSISSSPAVAEAPALRETIHNRNDPNKGRFGGRARARGCQLTATFEPGRSKDLSRIMLTVRGSAADGSEVQFFLHDSFKPSLVRRRFKNGSAELAVIAWGGFTVGVWFPDARVQLELDLSKVKGAPDHIRDL